MGIALKRIRHLIEQRALLAARSAPRRPEIHDKDLALISRHGQWSSVQLLDDKFQRILIACVWILSGGKSARKLDREAVIARENKVTEIILGVMFGQIGASQLAPNLLAMREVGVLLRKGKRSQVIIQGPGGIPLDGSEITKLLGCACRGIVS